MTNMTVSCPSDFVVRDPEYHGRSLVIHFFSHGSPAVRSVVFLDFSLGEHFYTKNYVKLV